MGLSPGMTLLMLVCVQMGPWNRTVVYFFHSLVPSFLHSSIQSSAPTQLPGCYTHRVSGLGTKTNPHLASVH